LADLETFYGLCMQKGLKITPQRIEVYKTLVSCSDHPSVEAIYKKVKQVLPNISFDTVNRTLNTLNDIGAAFLVAGDNVKRFDGNLEYHHHFKCIKCRNIIDFKSNEFENIKVPEKVGQMFKVLRATVYAEGLCPACLEKENKIKQ
jgi:Fur family transcriptional regulator, peroxide stress response regulator